MIYFTAHTFKCVCHCRRAMFRVLGMYNFANGLKKLCGVFGAFQVDISAHTLSNQQLFFTKKFFKEKSI